ncbi:hypothetical protein [Sphingomonas sp. EC-HK361]|uniref:hypothetical protein n=1 Tax=Sphingomonas sp. EC-HK361 TaxID=2038397 RepID=UPI00125ED629|nr:hypothetical protein [Sphingomonas sp. EC-HK361]
MSIVLAAFIFAGGTPDTLVATAAKRLSVSDTQVAPRRSPYRIDPSAGDSPNAKDRAFVEDGQRCQVVGARMCTKRPRALLSTPLTD